MLMQMLRKIFLSICAGILGFSLVALAWSHSLSATLRNQETVRSWLADSGVYEEIGSNVVDQMAQKAGDDLAAVAENDELQQIAADALDSTNILQESIEQLLDNTYVWLEGGDPPRALSIDFSEASHQLAQGLGEYASKRAAGLPVCGPTQTMAMINNYDIWTAPCRPAQVSAVQIGDNAREEVLRSINVSDTNVEAGNIFGSNDGNPPEQIRQAYQISRWMPLLFASLAIGSALAIVFVSSSRSKGLGRAGWTTILSGIIIGLSAFFVSKGPGTVRNALKDSEQSTIDMAVRLVETAGQDVARMLWWYGALAIALGLIAATIAKAISKPPIKPTNTKSDYPVPPVDDSPRGEPDPIITPVATASQLENTQEKPQKPPRKIQL